MNNSERGSMQGTSGLGPRASAIDSQSPEPKASGPLSSGRHYDQDEFPRRCDHCPAPLVAGTRYRKVMAVLDSSDSFVSGDKALVEESYELVFCARCFERLSRWLQTPLSELPAEGEDPAELDDGELVDALEQELYILAEDPEPEQGRPGQREKQTAAEARLATVREIVDAIPESVFTAAEVGMLDDGDAIEAVGDLRKGVNAQYLDALAEAVARYDGKPPLRCTACDPSFGCFDDPGHCCKRPEAP